MTLFGKTSTATANWRNPVPRSESYDRTESSIAAG
jgi:hypothetical protein